MGKTAAGRRLNQWLQAQKRPPAQCAAAQGFTETAYATWQTAQAFNVGFAEHAATALQRKISTVQTGFTMLQKLIGRF
jgi:hypothetical protein